MNEVKWSDDDSVDSQRVKNIVSFDFESQRSGKIIDIDDWYTLAMLYVLFWLDYSEPSLNTYTS